jgi:thiamine biosynthesis lipoprotein
MFLQTILLASGALGAGGPEGPSVAIERRGTAMGTDLAISVEAADRPTALAASEAAFRAVLQAEERLSTWTGGGELARLNASPPRVPFVLSAELERDLARCDRWWRETGGAFDPAVGALVEVWDLRGVGRWPSPTELESARSRSGWDRVTLADRTVRREQPGLLIEEGGFGKGAGLTDALTALKTTGATSGLLDLGGQIALFGPGERTLPLADPRDRGRAVLELVLDGGSIATSGNSQRRLVQDNRTIGHILDPGTGAPAPGPGSVTVWTPSPLDADCLSTALFVMGQEAALDWTRQRRRAKATPPVEVLFLTWSGDVLYATASAGFRGRLHPLNPQVEITFSPENPSDGEAPGK